MGGAAAIATVVLIVTLSVQAAVARNGPAWVCSSTAVPAGMPGTITFFVVRPGLLDGPQQQQQPPHVAILRTPCCGNSQLLVHNQLQLLLPWAGPVMQQQPGVPCDCL